MASSGGGGTCPSGPPPLGPALFTKVCFVAFRSVSVILANPFRHPFMTVSVHSCPFRSVSVSRDTVTAFGL